MATTAFGLVGEYYVLMAERVYGDAPIPVAERIAMIVPAWAHRRAAP